MASALPFRFVKIYTYSCQIYGQSKRKLLGNSFGFVGDDNHERGSGEQGDGEPTGARQRAALAVVAGADGVDAGGEEGAGGGGGVRVQDVQQAVPAGGRGGARVHECTVCGLEFSMGQALGGHMRRHRGEPGAAVVITDTDSGGTSVPQPPAEAMPDLNYPPLEDAGDGQESSSGRSSEPELLNLLV
uniref:C2H2-type domain-containing protein n=1 Tax=Oryza brachyantha TaxID=4533 RepID=J3L5N1_ORYBR